MLQALTGCWEERKKKSFFRSSVRVAKFILVLHTARLNGAPRPAGKVPPFIQPATYCTANSSPLREECCNLEVHLLGKNV